MRGLDRFVITIGTVRPIVEIRAYFLIYMINIYAMKH